MRSLVTYPDENDILETPTSPIMHFDESLHSLLDEMKDIMIRHNGIGLAAPQVGESFSVFIMLSQSRFKGNKIEVIEVINPKILESSQEYQRFDEGCLSAPNIYVEIFRPKEIFVEFQDRNGNIKQAVMIEIEAVCFQHEYDHLQGTFFLDRTSRPQRKAALKILGVK